jgi:microsomal prostaglandin-E synthase 1
MGHNNDLHSLLQHAMTHDSLFVAYALTVLASCLNLLFLWGYSGFVRSRTKVVINPEDAATVAKGAAVQPVDPPEVARVLRAHANAMAVSVPFLLLAWLFVVAGGAARLGQIMFAVFVVARWAHTIVYLRAKQPWRTISFVVGMGSTAILFGNVVWLLVR